MIKELIRKLRPNVLIISGISAVVALMSLNHLLKLFAGQEILTPELLIAALSMTAGLCIGSLLTLAGQVATDPEPANYPAKEANELVDKLLDRFIK